MTRSKENRIEAACPVFDGRLRQQLLEMLNVQLADTVKAREMDMAGQYHPVDGRERLSSQQYFLEHAR